MADVSEEQAVSTALAPATDGSDAPIAVPSGQDVRLQDVIWNAPGPEGLTVRFRFIAPQIARQGGTLSPEVAIADMQALCQTYALPKLAGGGPQPAQIIISLSDVAVEFGAANPDATQFFEAFSVQDGRCIWEPF